MRITYKNLQNVFSYAALYEHFSPKVLVHSKKSPIFAFERRQRMDEIEEFISYLLADRGYSSRTTPGYRLALSSLQEFFTHIDSQLTWQTIDADIVRRWMADQKERGISTRSICHRLSAVRTFYKYQLRLGRVKANPARLIRDPKCDSPLPTFLKPAEVNQLFDDIDFPDNFMGNQSRTVLLTFYHTGIRLSELIGLNVADVNLAQCELKVTGKRNKQRIVPFGSELAEALRQHIEYRQQQGISHIDALFLSPKGRRITQWSVGKIVHQYLSLVTTQKKKSPHVLRHTFATAMLNNGADLEAIKELLGHESVATTEVYTHTTFADLKKQYKLAHPRA